MSGACEREATDGARGDSRSARQKPHKLSGVSSWRIARPCGYRGPGGPGLKGFKHDFAESAIGADPRTAHGPDGPDCRSFFTGYRKRKLSPTRLCCGWRRER